MGETAEIPIEHAETFKRLKLEGKFVVGYFGSHELSYGLFNLLDVIGQLNGENVHLVMVGNGKLKNELISYAKKKQDRKCNISTTGKKKMSYQH